MRSIGAVTTTRRRDPEELPTDSSARPSGDLQLQIFRQPRFQGQVRATGGSGRHRERSEAHSRDHGEGARHRAREEGPEEEARAAAKEAAWRRGAISFKRDGQKGRARPVSIRCVRGFRARPRTRIVPMRISWTRWNEMYCAGETPNRPCRPFGIFHSNNESILQILCPAHNRLLAERVYGPAFIQRKIDERRNGKSRSP